MSKVRLHRSWAATAYKRKYETQRMHARCSEQICLEGADLRRMHLTPLGYARAFIVALF